MVSIVWQQHNCMQVQITVIYLTMSEKNQLSASTTVVQIQLMWRKKLINNPSVHNQFNFQLNQTFSVYILSHLQKEGVKKFTINVSSSKFWVN